MRRATGSALAALLVLAVAAPAHAGPAAPSCPAVSDPAGDEQGLMATGGDPSGDLLSLTVGGPGTRVDAAVTLTALDASMPVVGHRYDVYLTDGERTIVLGAVLDSGHGSYDLQEFTTGSAQGDGAFATQSLGPVDGSFDPARRRIHLSVEAKRLGFDPRRRLSMSARSWRIASTMNTGPGLPLGYHGSEDTTDGSATYRLGTSCRLR